MNAARAGRLLGFSRFDFAVSVILFAALVAVLLVRVQFYQAEAERVAAEQLVGTLRTALTVRVAQLSGRGGAAGLERLRDENPMDWLSEKPHNYLGEYYAPHLEQLASGNWFFDRSDHSLVYLPNSNQSFSGKTSKFLRFKVKFLSPAGSSVDGQRKVANIVAFDQITDQVAVNTN